MIEARPLVSSLGLKVDSGHPYAVYSNPDILLVATGTGAVAAAAATGWAMGKFPGINTAINIGFAGAAEKTAPLDCWYLVNSIRDESSGKMLIPDILWKFGLPELPLLTVGKPVNQQISWEGLVDMEGSGFYEAARQFLSPDRIVLLKWVSDNFSDNLKKDDIRMRFESSMGDILPVVRGLQEQSRPEVVEQPAILEEVRDRLHVTETQYQFLRKWLDGYLKRGGSAETIRKILPDNRPANKLAGKRVFEELRHVLKG